MATTSIRTAVKTYLTEQLEDVLSAEPVAVSRSFPGPNLERDHVWIDRASGTVSYELMMAGRKVRTDDFTIWLVFQASGPGTTSAEADERVESYCAAFDSWLAADVTLGNMDGVTHALLGEVEGPDSMPIDEGHAAFMVAQINVKSRLL